MTFDEMLTQASALGFTRAQMHQNCATQAEQYESLSRAPNDMWAQAADAARACLAWLDAQAPC